MPGNRVHYFFLVGLPILVFSAFLTEIKLIPAISNNVGLFELLGGVTIAIFLVTHGRHPIAPNPIITLSGLLFVAASLSLINISYETFTFGLIQTSILLFLFLFLLALYNLFLKHQIDPAYFLRLITYAAAIVGPWILRQGALFEGDLDAVGPFRNRAHMGIYMLTAFWIVLIYVFWPEEKRRRVIRLALSLVAVSLSLYAVAISGRRSVYFSLFIGLAALIVMFLFILRRRRTSVAMAAAFTIAVLSTLYFQGADFLPRGDFFRSRVGMVGSRLRSATEAVSGEAENTFMSLQMEAIKAAVSQYPIVGLGWGSFYKWELNATRHEVHSTPLRFLAETGVIGFTVYILLLARLLIGSARLSLQMRASPYAGSYLILAIAIWSLTVSYLYNRHITERTFWLLLLVFLLLEAFAEGYQRSVAADRIPQPRPSPLPQPTLVPGSASATVIPAGAIVTDPPASPGTA